MFELCHDHSLVFNHTGCGMHLKMNGLSEHFLFISSRMSNNASSNAIYLVEI
jgi:hypothetical protein